jgi:hypothetical protein
MSKFTLLLAATLFYKRFLFALTLLDHLITVSCALAIITYNYSGSVE